MNTIVPSTINPLNILETRRRTPNGLLARHSPLSTACNKVDAGRNCRYTHGSSLGYSTSRDGIRPRLQNEARVGLHSRLLRRQSIMAWACPTPQKGVSGASKCSRHIAPAQSTSSKHTHSPRSIIRLQDISNRKLLPTQSQRARRITVLLYVMSRFLPAGGMTLGAACLFFLAWSRCRLSEVAVC